MVIPCFTINSDTSRRHILRAFIQHICIGIEGGGKIRNPGTEEEGIGKTYPGVHVHATHRGFGPQLLCYGPKVADHVCAGGSVVNRVGVRRMLSEEIVVERQMGQYDRDAAFQRKASICIPGLGKLYLQVGQAVEMRTELGDECFRPLQPWR